MVVQLREQDEIECLRKLLDELPFLTVKNGMFGSPSENMQRPVREPVADYLGGKTVEVYLTSNRIIGLALIYQGLPLRAGDEVLTTSMKWSNNPGHFQRQNL